MHLPCPPPNPEQHVCAWDPGVLEVVSLRQNCWNQNSFKINAIHVSLVQNFLRGRSNFNVPSHSVSWGLGRVEGLSCTRVHAHACLKGSSTAHKYLHVYVCHEYIHITQRPIPFRQQHPEFRGFCSARYIIEITFTFAEKTTTRTWESESECKDFSVAL